MHYDTIGRNMPYLHEQGAKLSQHAVYRMLRAGVIPNVRAGQKVLFDADWVLDRLKTDPASLSITSCESPEQYKISSVISR